LREFDMRAAVSGNEAEAARAAVDAGVVAGAADSSRKIGPLSRRWYFSDASARRNAL